MTDDIIMIILISTLVIFLLVGTCYYVFSTSYHDKCYINKEDHGYAVFGECSGEVDGDRSTEHLDYKCIDCPYLRKTYISK